MPATFPSHAGAVAPLKVWRPTWFDGVALIAGAATPDLFYVAGCCRPGQTVGHTWWGTVAAVPISFLLCWLIRWAAPVTAAHLPGLGPFALRDYGVLGSYRPKWWITMSSAWLGAFSHVLWDHLTHASIEGTDLGLPVLGSELAFGVPWWMPLHLASSAVGALVWLAVTLHIGRRRLLVTWHGPAPSVPLRPGRFWSVIGLVGVGGSVLVLILTWFGAREAMVGFLPPVPRPVVLVMRVGLVLGFAVLVAVAATRSRSTGPDSAERPVEVAQ